MAQMTLAVIRRLFSWHAARSDDFNSPIVRGMSRIKASERQRDRILDDDEIARIWKVVEADESAFGPYVQFLLLTGCRRDEAACLPWDEIRGNVWTLPAARNKTKKTLERPLSTAAMTVLARTPRITGSAYVFTAIGGRYYAYAHRKRELDRASGVHGWRIHDLRRTAKTLLARAGVAPHISERCLGHVVGGVEGVYDKHSYRDEMLRAYEALAALLETITNPPAANVVPMRKV
jgi:integrase